MIQTNYTQKSKPKNNCILKNITTIFISYKKCQKTNGNGMIWITYLKRAAYYKHQHYHYTYTRKTKNNFSTKNIKMKLKILDYRIMMNSNHFCPWQFNQGWPQMGWQV
jgi:hypothetical protein